jgi:predicted nucleotidyltransferase
MQTVVEMTFGSHLYGTDTPSSDLDIKAIHIPAGRDILLGRGTPIITRKIKADHTARNGAGAIDFEGYRLRK